MSGKFKESQKSFNPKVKKIENDFLKVLNFRCSYKVIVILLYIVLFVSLIPLAFIAKYDVPSSDDFGHCIWTHPVFAETGSIFSTIITAFKWVGYCFHNISGTFSVQVLDALAPNVFGERFYVITPFLMFFVLFIGTVIFNKNIFERIFKVERKYVRIITLVSLILFVQFLPSVVEGFYWYVGAVTYTAYFALFIIVFSFLLRYYFSEYSKCKMTIRTSVCSFLLGLAFFILGGGNHVTALMSGVAVIALIVFSLLFKKRITFYIFPSFAWICAFAINVLAPGNAVRSETVGGGAGFLKSFFFAFRAVAMCAKDWLSLPVLAIIAFLVPILWVAANSSNFSFIRPGYISFFSVCFLAAMFYPPIFGMNSIGQGRLQNIVFFAFIILLIFNIFYWLGWINHQTTLSFTKSWKNGVSLAFMFAVVIAVGFGTVATVKTPVSSFSAVKSIVNGEAIDFYETAQKRFELLNDSSLKNVTIPSFEEKPYVIFFRDITQDPEDGLNIAMADYYQKETVVCKNEN